MATTQPTERGSDAADARENARSAWRLLPGPFRHPRWRGTFVRWGLAGVLLRVLMLPVGITTDTLAVYWRSHLIAFHGELFDRYLVNMGSHALHAVWLRIVQPLMGPAEELWTHPWWWDNLHTLAPAHMEVFWTRPDALRIIALLKLPYVLADLAAGLVLLALLWPRNSHPSQVQGGWRIRRAWILWMLSPVALYATQLWTRYESYPVLAILIALLLAERGRVLWAAVVLGFAITLRTYPILFVPIFALVLYRDLPRQIGWAALAVAPFGATMALNRLVGGNFGELAAVGDFSFGGNFFAFALQPDRGGPGVFLFVAAALTIGVYLLGRPRGWWGSGPVPRAHLWRWVAITHLAMFAFSQFSPHYLMWLMPAIGLLLGRTHRKGIVPLHLVQFGGVLVGSAAIYGGFLLTGHLGGLGATARRFLPDRALFPGDPSQVGNVLWTAFWVATLAIAIPFVIDTLRADPRAGRPHVSPDGASAG